MSTRSSTSISGKATLGTITLVAIRDSLQVIQSSAEHLAESGGSETAARRVTSELKKIDRLLTRLEAEMIPLENGKRG